MSILGQPAAELVDAMEHMLHNHPNVMDQPTRAEMIDQALKRREAIDARGPLATWTDLPSSARAPKDTYTVRQPASEANVDWTSPNAVPLAPTTFDMLWHDALKMLMGKPTLFRLRKSIGANEKYAMPVTVVADQALSVLFTDNMMRPVPADMTKSVFNGQCITMLVVPKNRIPNIERYEGLLRKLPNGQTSDMAIAMDYDRKLAIVIGNAYGGCIKKTAFTMMNFLLPDLGILPLHCSANEGHNGDCAILLGLSGTGKTTLSADPERALLGDDEHGWGDDGVYNFEGGCYAKLINLDASKEPEIYNAVFHPESDPRLHGSLIENAMVFPDGTVDLFDGRLTENSRVSYPLRFLSNIKISSCSSHPTTILFLTADANAVLPPISKLNKEQAMLWFMMGYTSRVAGTEAGLGKDPQATFSRFFGEPFILRQPAQIAGLLGKKMDKHNVSVFLVNTGWSQGPAASSEAGVKPGKRMSIHLTRALVKAAINGDLNKVEYEEDPVLHVNIPKSCPGVDAALLNNKNTWEDKDAYDRARLRLAGQFKAHFEKAYGDHGIDAAIKAQCPGF